jgi:hypothetical protein
MIPAVYMTNSCRLAMTILISLIIGLLFMPAPCRAVSGYVKGGPNSGHTTVIIFIHGYRGSNASWSSKTDPDKTLPTMIGSDPEISRFADVYLFDYMTDTTSEKAELPASIARELTPKVYQMDKDGKLNIILVCHSMGGLIAWSLIDEMMTIQIGKQLFKAVITLGTPYLGTALSPADFAALISPNKQIYALLGIRNNPYADSLNAKKAESSTERHIDVYCAYETKPMPHLGIVVDRASATAFCSPEKQTSINSDHEQLVRPDSPAYSDNFAFIKSAILDSRKKWPDQ